MYSIKLYGNEDKPVWDAFVKTSKNGTFLFCRNFMEYHADRFTDHSLLVYEGQKLLALLPANSVEATVYSHRGLTYGGLILPKGIGFEKVRDIFAVILKYLNETGVSTFQIKQIPLMYNTEPTFEVDYLIFAAKGSLVRKDLNLAVDYKGEKWISKSKLKHYKRRADVGFEIKKSHNFKEFWEKALVPRLREKHNAAPVHTVAEIELLASRFPENILQASIYLEGEIMAGITLFISGDVVKSQYGATTPDGERVRALDYLFISLLEEYRNTKNYFDMGTVMERDGSINMGLLKQKEELGCSLYYQDSIEVPTANYTFLLPKVTNTTD